MAAGLCFKNDEARRRRAGGQLDAQIGYGRQFAEAGKGPPPRHISIGSNEARWTTTVIRGFAVGFPHAFIYERGTNSLRPLAGAPISHTPHTLQTVRLYCG